MTASAAQTAGLTSQEAAARFARYGPNVSVTHRQRVLVFLTRFRNPLVLLLLAASASTIDFPFVFDGDRLHPSSA